MRVVVLLALASTLVPSVVLAETSTWRRADLWIASKPAP